MKLIVFILLRQRKYNAMMLSWVKIKQIRVKKENFNFEEPSSSELGLSSEVIVPICAQHRVNIIMLCRHICLSIGLDVKFFI